MIQKKTKKNEKKILIACYQRPFSESSIETIKNFLDENKPDEVLILIITERKESSGTIDSYLGRKDIQKLKQQYEKDQEIRSGGYADRIVDISQQLHISVEKKKKKGDIAKIINEEIKKYKPDFVIINHSEKSTVDKMMTGCVEDVISEQCGNVIIV